VIHVPSKIKSLYQISKVVNTLLEVHVSYTVEVQSMTLTADLLLPFSVWIEIFIYV